MGTDDYDNLLKELYSHLNDYNNLQKELYSHLDDYDKLYGPERINKLIHIFSYYENWPTSSNQWMTMPEMGYLIGLCYNVILFHLSSV